MSCLDVMYHQSYGAHYLPAAAYKATYYNHHHHHPHSHQQQQQQQQRKLSVHSKMQECAMEQHHQQHQGGARGIMSSRDQDLQHGGPRRDSSSVGSAGAMSESDPKDGTQPAEAEYLGSRCVLFTYFQGDVGDVIDEHFSRALSQSSAFNGETKPIRVCQQPTSAWKDSSSLTQGQSGSVWNNATYPPPPPAQTTSCLPSVSVSVHPDFTPSTVPFTHSDGTLWASHMLSQAGLPPAGNLGESWTYSLNAQSGTSGYPNVHDMYHPHSHAHVHSRHSHPHPHRPVLHSYSAHGPAMDPRFNPLLLPGVRNSNQTAASAGSSPHSEGVKTEMEHGSNSPVTSLAWSPSPLHGSLEAYDSGLDQTKAKTSAWF